MTAASPGESEPVFRLVYRSHSRIPAEDRPKVLARIFDVARSRNKAARVTGALLITDHYFVQALEGDEAAVRSLFDSINSDERHTDVTIVEEGTWDERTFSRWSMAQVSASGKADIPLHSNHGEIHAAARSSLTREQMALLKRMRNTIGADAV
ncbi:BLUF domain-containing protein [Pseudonocardia sp. KRD-184]|nr:MULTISPECIES: BLUF domain-containing protein [Pseudonocardia]MBW0092782.1 BLUF domain-containing protein [Pseudonocardia oceani]MBW0100421.1 BLUF domain-containing protein [Pseudonocardia oceani]MBW0113156.1 BLUF domain-containing protein [Pseudonocardia oceani]MBW0121928.1 BLUF domain-containing protein [Pseudonocardia oceani]MBW0128186.1 BLUF domain-containing protein [Pseudonocardia oceani]